MAAFSMKPLAFAAVAVIGFAVAVDSAKPPAESPAVPAKLIGKCHGGYMAAVEESAFPEGCLWIEPIKEESI